ncbi:MAG: hypothetical protein EHM72_04180 [Calditrichaeota bacterium]|nr:MAG: hypothetical protein EHM72_04180 [Calditrichota bacterium]
MIDLTHEDYYQKITRNNATCCVEIRADWSGDCFLMEAILQQMETEFAERIQFVQVNVGAEPKIAKEYGVTELPMLLLFKKGELVECMVGLQSKTQLRSHLKKIS